MRIRWRTKGLFSCCRAIEVCHRSNNQNSSCSPSCSWCWIGARRRQQKSYSPWLHDCRAGNKRILHLWSCAVWNGRRLSRVGDFLEQLLACVRIHHCREVVLLRWDGIESLSRLVSKSTWKGRENPETLGCTEAIVRKRRCPPITFFVHTIMFPNGSWWHAQPLSEYCDDDQNASMNVWTPRSSSMWNDPSVRISWEIFDEHVVQLDTIRLVRPTIARSRIAVKSHGSGLIDGRDLSCRGSWRHNRVGERL